ncbi:MAG: T9SS type A sorting domain-containing protein [Tannerella sp.]|jgi:poly(3-hydroxybutyrate) depolymerase|nr:T9SS type A sorting domain-containing protein [Tannerella sp.]
MKKAFCTIWLMGLSVIGLMAVNPEKKTIQVDGMEREYLIYIPENNHSVYDGIMVGLHGFNSSMDVFFNNYSITQIADSLNYIILAPQALPEQDLKVIEVAELANIFGNTITLDAVWGCGMRVIVSMQLLVEIKWIDEVLNQNVDDVAFISRIIEQTRQTYKMNENVFLIGTSMGGFMAYQYALQQPLKLSGIVSVAGSMGLSVKGMDNGMKVPVCDFHSVTDEVVPYLGTGEQSGMKVQLAQSKEDVLHYWTETNGAGEPVVENVNYYPSTNGITVEKITYPDLTNEVIHYKMNGSSHSYFFHKESGDCMDYVEEIGKFIAAHTIRSNEIENIAVPDVKIYPNPARDVLFLGCTEGNVSIYDYTGKRVMTTSFQSGHINISSLKRGMYIVVIKANGQVYTSKLIKQ